MVDIFEDAVFHINHTGLGRTWLGEIRRGTIARIMCQRAGRGRGESRLQAIPSYSQQVFTGYFSCARNWGYNSEQEARPSPSCSSL